MALIQTTAFNKIAVLEKEIRCICGGQSAGKTFAILQFLIYYSLKRKITISVVAESIPALKRGAYKDFLTILEEMGLYKEENHNRTDRIYKLNNSSFQFFGCEEPTKLKGLRSDVMYMNEANNCPWQSWFELSSRTRLFSFLDYNPDAPFWAMEKLIGNDNVDFITLTYKDNEALEEKLVKEIESWKILGETDDSFWNLWLTRGLGRLGKLSGAIITNWTEIDELPQAQILGSGMDFGFTNDPTTLISVYRHNGQLIWDEVIYEKGLLNSKIAEKIKPTDARHSLIVADSAEPKSIAELKTHGLSIIPVYKGKDSISWGLSLIQSEPFLVTSRSKNLIKELQNYTWAKDKNGESLNVPIDNWNHAIDAARYFYLNKMGNKGNNFSLKWRR